MTQKTPFALLTNMYVLLSGQYSPSRNREVQVVTQAWVFIKDSNFDISWQEEKLELI